MTYLSIAAAAWWLVAMTAVGVWIHAHRTAKAMRAFNDHATSAIAVTRRQCWPTDVDGVAVCGECDRLWRSDRVCPIADGRRA